MLGRRGESPTVKLASLRWLYGFLQPQKTALLAVFLLSLATSLLVLVQPLLTKQIIDEGILAKEFSALALYAGLLLLSVFLGTLLSGLNRLKYTRLSGKILFALRQYLFSHMLSLGPQFFQRFSHGDLISRLDRDISEIQRFAVDTLFSSMSAILGLAFTLTAMISLSPTLSLSLLVLIPLELFYLAHIRPKVQQNNYRNRQQAANISAFLTEAVPRIPAIQNLSAEGPNLSKLEGLNHNFLTSLLALHKVEFFASSIPAMLVSATKAGVFLVGGYWVIQDTLSLGALIAFGSYLGMALGPVQSLLGLYLSWHRMAVNLERVDLIRHQPTACREGKLISELGPIRGDIRLENIDFAFGERSILRQVSLHIPAGSKVALCGNSGAGKSTLVNLLLQNLQADSGRILLDDIAIDTLNTRAWRQRIALVSQAPVIFRGSLAENVRLARPEASDAQLIEACGRAGLSELILKLEKGVNSPLNENGANLSLGEIQRIELARALLKQPLLVILDEPTSAVDQAMEQKMISAVDQSFAGITRIIISHRPTTVAQPDLRLSLVDGRLESVASLKRAHRHG